MDFFRLKLRIFSDMFAGVNDRNLINANGTHI